MSSKTPKNYLSPFYNTTTTLNNSNNNNNNHQFEFDEQDLWNKSYSSNSSTPESKNPIPAKRAPRKPWGSLSRPYVACSVPVNIPDWSKIMGKEDNDNQYSEDDEDELEEMLPPHEYVAKKLARSRIVPFSVHEGVGRTLKGRDLNRVRNAVWKQTGFED